MRPIRHSRRRGFTLVEVMVSMALLGISLVGALTMLSTSWDVLHRTQEKMEVNNILKSTLEELRDFTYDELEELPADIYFWPSSYGGLFYSLGYRQTDYYSEDLYQFYEQQRYLHNAMGRLRLDQIEPNLMRATVDITWSVGGGDREMTMTTVTMISRNGVNRQ